MGSTHGQLPSCRARPVNVDDGLEGMSRSRQGGEKLPAASFAPLPDLDFFFFFCHRREVETFVPCVQHRSAQMRLYQTPGPRPPHITARVVNTLTRGWVRAPNERASFRFHGAIVGFVDRCRGLGISPLRINIWLSFS